MHSDVASLHLWRDEWALSKKTESDIAEIFVDAKCGWLEKVNKVPEIIFLCMLLGWNYQTGWNYRTAKQPRKRRIVHFMSWKRE
jgi:hypothetical protein